MDDYHNNSSLIPLFPTATRTATANGTGVDIRAFIGTLKFIMDCAAGTGTLDVAIQDSNDDGGTDPYVTVSSFAQVVDGVASLQSIGIPANSLKRWVRARGVMGATPSKAFSVNAVGAKQHRP